MSFTELVVHALAIALFTAAVAFARSNLLPWLRHPLRRFPGPRAPWWSGNTRDVAAHAAGALPLGFFREHDSSVIVYGGMIGQRIVSTTDPTALTHVLINRVALYPKAEDFKALVDSLQQHSVIAVGGDDHKRQRRLLNKAFSKQNIDALFPVFFQHVDRLKTLWLEREDALILDLKSPCSDLTLDIIGHAGFGAHFGCLEDAAVPLAVAFKRMLTAPATHSPSFIGELFELILRRNPYLLRVFQRKMVTGMAQLAQQIDKHGAQILAERRRLLDSGTEVDRDILSIIMTANDSESEKTRLLDKEVQGNIAAFLLAGHETTATSLTWALLLLAEHPTVQSRLRSEVLQAFAAAREDGLDYPSAESIHSLHYLDGVVREVLRLRPPAAGVPRVAAQDDHIPLSEPVTVKDGSQADSIPVRKDDVILVSISSFNRSKSLYGDDADDFKPERWLETEISKAQQAGKFTPFAPLLSFSAGPRSCIAYQFAVAELKCAIAGLVESIEFTPRDASIRFEPGRSPLVAGPVIIGEEDKGFKVPIRIARAP